MLDGFFVEEIAAEAFLSFQRLLKFFQDLVVVVQEIICSSFEHLVPEHLAGSSLVDKMTTGLLNTADGETSNILLDLLGFDGWPACFAMQQTAAGESDEIWLDDLFYAWKKSCFEFVWKSHFCFTEKLSIRKLNAFWGDVIGVVGSLHGSPLFAGRQFACATTCHSTGEAHYCTSAIGQKAYAMCRNGSLKLPGFPEFENVVNELKTNTTDLPTPAFEVCLPVPNGIAIKQNLVDYWMTNDMFQVEMAELLEKHNSKYNPHGTKRGLTESTTEGPLAAIIKAII